VTATKTALVKEKNTARLNRLDCFIWDFTVFCF